MPYIGLIKCLAILNPWCREHYPIDELSDSWKIPGYKLLLEDQRPLWSH